MLFEPAHAGSHKMKRLLKPALLLAIVSLCLFGYVLHYQSGIFREFEVAFLSLQWMLLVCMAVWCGSFIFLTFSLNDLPLIGLLLIAIIMYFIGEAASWKIADAVILLAGVTLGKGVCVLLSRSSRRESALTEKSETENQKSGIDQSGLTSAATFLTGIVVLLVFSSWWHLEVAHNFYPGTRWTGLWDNPNIYGMLMGAGAVLAIGLLAASLKSKVQSPKSVEFGEHSRLGCRSARLAQNTGTVNDGASLPTRGARVLPIILIIAAGMMAVGLLFSYSRGAWLGTVVGLLYLAKAHGRFKWRYVVTGFGLLALGILLFWGRTPVNAPWYMKRMDFGRPSAQHRVAAWRGALQMMRDHPFGVGWNKAVNIYEKNYSAPENGAAAITMNSYLMLGTELGLPGLICFISYVALRLRSPKPKVQSPKSAAEAEGGKTEFAQEPARGDARPTTLDIGHWTLDSSKTACRAGALMLLVAFWFDGGLFTLATAAVFWILLELGDSDKFGETNQQV
jgi:hypothetical protein